MDENLALMDEDEVHADRVAAILEAVEAGDAVRLTALMEPWHAADIADGLEQIGGLMCGIGAELLQLDGLTLESLVHA